MKTVLAIASVGYVSAFSPVSPFTRGLSTTTAAGKGIAPGGHDASCTCGKCARVAHSVCGSIVVPHMLYNTFTITTFSLLYLVLDQKALCACPSCVESHSSTCKCASCANVHAANCACAACSNVHSAMCKCPSCSGTHPSNCGCVVCSGI